MIPQEKSRARARKLRLMAFDVDGVLSEGSLNYNDDGVEMKAFNSLDGLGMKMLQRAGITVAIITGRKARCVEWRMKNLGIDILYQGIEDKRATMEELLAKLGVSAEEAGYMGDDIVDLHIMDLCGFAAAPADSHEMVFDYVDFASSKIGGRGAVREVCEFILDAQGKLDEALAPYLPARKR
jgi:3-deoxy-D-manno-octulosonate 8-phosphate phosphatase (KDO 8-P phosphatase)